MPLGVSPEEAPMRGSEHLLFSDRELREVMHTAKTNMAKEIESYPADTLLNTPPSDLASYLAEKYQILPLRLFEEGITADQAEIKVDVSRDPNRHFSDPSRPFYIPGTVLSVHIPFEGEAELFYARPSRYTDIPPRAVVQSDHLEIAYRTIEHDEAKAKQEIDSLLGKIKSYLTWIASDLSPFNASLLQEATPIIDRRKQRLLKDRGLVASLGFPLRARTDELRTYTTPQIRRKVTPRPPEASTKPYAPEPAIETAEYENILTIVKTTASVLERSPTAFRDMDEEDLRNQFLVPLNSHYEGQATGETFNFGGKTDILVRDGDRSVFVAECKIWRGPKSLSDAIDQLLGYATWRDSKAAILLFNRTRGLSTVLVQIPQVTSQHPSFKRATDARGPNDFRFVLAHPSDKAREMALAVLVFDIPR